LDKVASGDLAVDDEADNVPCNLWGEEDADLDDGIICDGCDSCFHRMWLVGDGFEIDDAIVDSNEDWFWPSCEVECDNESDEAFEWVCCANAYDGYARNLMGSVAWMLRALKHKHKYRYVFKCKYKCNCEWV
jgi:hypothetical protein